MSRSQPQPKKAPLTRDHIFKSGKYAGESVGDVVEINPGYIIWLAKNTDIDFEYSIVEEAEDAPFQNT
jgi:hypothetical protein